jgi:hypothetical protein
VLIDGSQQFTAENDFGKTGVFPGLFGLQSVLVCTGFYTFSVPGKFPDLRAKFPARVASWSPSQQANPRCGFIED